MSTSKVLLYKARSPPFHLPLDCVGIGMVLDIDGRRTENEAFSINLSSAPDLSKDVFIHFSPRPQQNKIVLNTMKDGKWCKEESIPWYDMFDINIDFKLRLTAAQNGYEIYDRRDVPRLIGTFAYRQKMECNYLVFGGQGCTISFAERD
ncbi:galectin-7-like [Littorina saxatilis]|uniref:Galectin n=1 Tax=Littorina saxatilis TaxID=31220 RepID=A0AAN9FVI4_9CAEN